MRGAKFWQGEEDIMAGLVVWMWQVAARPAVECGSEVWACSSEHSEPKLEVLQGRVGRALIGLSWRFPGVVVRGELGLEKMNRGDIPGL